MRLLTIAVLSAVFALPVHGQSLSAKLDASRLASRVEIALAQDETLRAFAFRPEVRDGVLTLMGRVATAAQRDRAAALAQEIEGVESVVNRVTVEGTAAPSVAELPAAPVDTSATVGEEASEDAEPAPEPEKVYHTVRRGDVLGAIARRYGVSVRQVQRLNGLRGTNIRVGQRLRVE